MRKILFSLVAASVAIGPVSVAVAKTSEAQGDKICKRQAKTGTRFASKICYTKAEWEEITEANKRADAEAINRPVVNIGKGN